jgi:hypothetical protein
MYAAWCGQLQLFGAAFQQEHERNLLRLRYRDMTPAEFFAGTCGGVLDAGWLEPLAREFTRTYYPSYMDDYRETFGGDVYGVADDWAQYERIAPVLTRRLMDFRERYPSRRGGRRRRGEGRARRWWQVWR